MGTRRRGKRRDAAAALAGVDGTPAGGVVVACDDARGGVRAFCGERLTDLPRDLRVVAVDVPIGLAERGPRRHASAPAPPSAGHPTVPWIAKGCRW